MLTTSSAAPMTPVAARVSPNSSQASSAATLGSSRLMMLAAVAVGNGFTALVNHYIQNADGSVKLSMANYYLSFAIFMVIVTGVYVPFTKAFKERSHLQG